MSLNDKETTKLKSTKKNTKRNKIQWLEKLSKSRSCPIIKCKLEKRLKGAMDLKRTANNSCHYDVAITYLRS